MKLRFLTVVMSAVLGLGVLAAGAAPAAAHDCDHSWGESAWDGDYCYRPHSHQRFYRRAAFYDDDPFVTLGYGPGYRHFHHRYYRRRVVTVYRTVPVYHVRHYYRRVRHYYRPHRVTRVYRVTTYCR